MKQDLKASIMIVAAGFFWGIIGIFIRLQDAMGFDTMQIVFVRMLVAFISFAIYLAVTDKSKIRIDIKDIWMFVCTGVLCIFVHNITYFYAVVNGEASVAVILVYTAPIFVMLVSSIVFKEKITKKRFLALVLSFAGCLCISGVLGGSFSTPPKVIAIGVLSGFSYGMYSVFSKIAMKKYSNETINLYTFLFVLLTSVFMTDIPYTLNLMFDSVPNLLISVSSGLLCCLVPFFLYTKGLKNTDASKATILVSTDPMVASIIGFTVLGDDCTLLKVLGVVLVLSSIVILNTKEH